MAEMPDPEERFKTVLEAIVTAYMLIGVYLERLPLPIVLPEMDDHWTSEIGVPAVDRAQRTLITEQPIDSLARSLYQRMLLDWLVAYELGALVLMAGPAPWRLDGIETALARIVTSTDLLDELRDDDPSQE